MSPAAVHLHVHSEYSLLDGACKIDALAQRAAAYGQPALGLTDHGVMNGAVEHYKACKKHGIKPILGLEAYYVDDRASQAVRRERNHLTLLAESDEGFRNLVKLTSAGFLEGWSRGKPNVDMELLERHSTGVIALTGCLASRFCRRLVDDAPAEARAHVDHLMQAFGPENVYFEVQKNGIPDQDKANEGIVRVAREVGRPLVATGDVHYLGREDYTNHAALLCVQTKSTIAEPKLSFDTNEFYLKDSTEMETAFAQWPEAVPTSLEIAERCEVEIELGKLLIPSYETPNGQGEGVFLRGLAEAGLRRRYGDPPPAEAVERMEMELEVIGRMGFDAYFLIVWDLVTFAKGQGIAVGPGRGSAASSIVSYCLDITEADPLAYGLLFERFLNPERVSMPDFDIDFSVKGREQVIRYVSDKYGKESVAQIVTFGKMLPRNATRDAARVLGKDYATGDRLAKLIPEPVMGRSKSFEEYLKDEPELKRAYDSEPDAREVIDTARGLEGIVRNAGVHAAAVLIADRPLTDIVPLQLMDDRAGVSLDGERCTKVVTQYSMKPIEEIGLLKIDFLGLRNLDVITDCLEIIEESTGVRPDMTELPLDDAKTFEMLSRGASIGVFQLESDGMREALKKVRPTEFADIVAMVALYRPGAMRHIDTYARNKRNPEAVTYIDDRLRAITEPTYSVILYQEQSMQIAKAIAGFSGAEADDLRKAIGKKNRAAMAALRERFFEGARATGTNDRAIDELWSVNEAAADYSFNKCASRDTRVILPTGERIRLSTAYKRQPEEIMAMWPDGEVRPHRVAKIVRTGSKHVVRVRCASGRQIKATLDHRLLTTEGYKEIGKMGVGTELITLPMISERQRAARRETMRKLAQRPGRKAQDQRAAARMRLYQARRTPEEKVAHMKRMHELHPHILRNLAVVREEAHKRVIWLYENDPEWKQRQIAASFAAVRACYDTGPGYGRCSIASNGMWCASQPERDMCEYLIEQSTEFEMHKVLPTGRMCDFYFDGVYWEMDGMDRAQAFFAEKYGDLPYVVVTPEDFKLVIATHLQKVHAENGDPIVSIEDYGPEATYDVEMAPHGPLNYIANGIVSHNSHATCYGLISYRTAWLRANYPAEYMAALISSVMSTKDKVPFFVSCCEEMGIEVLPPDVNECGHRFVVVDGNIRFGLDAVKNVGAAAVDAIIVAREEGGPFSSIWDFCRRVDCRAVNKKATEALIKGGAFDSTGATRTGLLQIFEQAQGAGQKTQQDALSGQASIFDLEEPAPGGGLDGSNGAPDLPVPALPDERAQLNAWEREALGLFLSSHPLKEVRPALRARVDSSLAELSKRRDGELVTVGGMITECKRIRTRKGDPMLFATLDDLEGQVEMLVFNSAYAANAEKVDVDKVVIVKGRVDHKEQGEVKLIAQEVEPFEPSAEEVLAAAEAAEAEPVLRRLTVDVHPGVPETFLEDLKDLCRTFPGDHELELRVGPRRLVLGEEYRISATTACRSELSSLPGAGLAA